MNQPLVPCRACRVMLSVNAATCPNCGQPAIGRPSPVAKIVAAVGAAIFGAWALCMAFGISIPRLISGTPGAYVECRAAGVTIAAGMSCTIEHRSGSGAVSVCWDIMMECANGTRGTAHGCGDAQPGGKVSVAVPFVAFGGTLDECDKVTTTSVAGLVMK
jgi:hypothetical protein